MSFTPKSQSSSAGIGSRVILDQVDELRKLGLSNKISLPQIVVVGAQSAGKSSLLDSLTGFRLPTSVTLATRHATEIICRRADIPQTIVSIQPFAQSSRKTNEFRREMVRPSRDEWVAIYEDAAKFMGIKSKLGKNGEQRSAFSRDILRVEISGPEEGHLTVIDVPGIFEVADKDAGTRESDIDLVKEMVRNYIRESRTIILAVVPCTGDVANQTILTYARKADPEGKRTLGVLTKPDVPRDNATKRFIYDLVLKKRQDLKLGYCVVQNRNPDDSSPSPEERDRAEEAFFKRDLWAELPRTRVGIPALKIRLQRLLMERTRSEFPSVKREIKDMLSTSNAQLEEMGEQRSTPQQQRAYLGRVATEFSDIRSLALDARYSKHEIFNNNEDLKLISRIRDVNEGFSAVLHKTGHSREFARLSTDAGQRLRKRAKEAKLANGDHGMEVKYHEEPEEVTEERYKVEEYEEDDESILTHGAVFRRTAVNGKTNGFNMPGRFLRHLDDIDDSDDPDGSTMLSRDALYERYQCTNIPRDETDELGELLSEPYRCPDPSDNDILAWIKAEYLDSRGYHLGTFSEAVLHTTFREQAEKWRPTALAHASNAILIVHNFIRKVLQRCCPDEEVRRELWGYLMEKLMRGYDKAMKKAKSLLKMEFSGNSITYKPEFHATLARIRAAKAPGNKLKNDDADDDDIKQIHHLLKAFYETARGRVVDVFCQHVVDNGLLHGPRSPLWVFSHDVVDLMKDEDLERIAGEDMATRDRREELVREVADYTKALKILRG